MRKDLSLIIALSLFLLFNINISANEEGFNYIYTLEELDKDYITDLYYLADGIEDLTCKYYINYEISDNENSGLLIFEYYIENSYAKYLKITINDYLIYDLEFNGSTANLYSIGSYDLNNISINNGIIKYKDFKTNTTIENPSLIPFLFSENKLDRIVNRIKYIDGVNKDLSYFKASAPSIDNITQISILEHDYIEDINIYDTNYDPNNLEEGNYYLKLFAKRSDGTIYKDVYNLNIKNDSDYFYCSDIYISYNNVISSSKIFEYYIKHYDKENVIKYFINSDYFNNSDKIGKYKYDVTLEFFGDDRIIYPNDCYIYVIDDVKPILKANLNNDIGDGTFIDINELITLNAYDEIDGNLDEYIKVIDNDDYLINYNKTGTYTFDIYVTDSSSNTSFISLSYDVLIEVKEEEDIVLPSIDDDISIVYEFNVTTANVLTRALFSQKLVFSGFYKEGDELTISSKYFENKEIPGSYLASVYHDGDIKYFIINVEEGKNEDVIVNDDTSSYKTPYIIISVIIIGGVLGFGVFYFYKIRKRKSSS